VTILDQFSKKVFVFHQHDTYIMVPQKPEEPETGNRNNQKYDRKENGQGFEWMELIS